MTSLSATNRVAFPNSFRTQLGAWLQNAPRGAFWRFFIASLFFSFGFSIFAFLFNLYLLDFGYTERLLGILGGLVAAGGIVATIPIGMLAQRFGLRRTLLCGLMCCIAFSVLRSCIVWQPAQLALAALTGLTICSWAVCLSPAVAALTTEAQRPFAFSLMFSSGIAMAGLGGLVSGHLPGWIMRAYAVLMANHVPLVGGHAAFTAIEANRLTLLAGCAIVGIALIPLWRLTQHTAAPKVTLPRWSNPFLRRFLPAMAVWCLVTGAFPQFANVYFVRHLGLSIERMGSVFSISQMIQFVALLSAPLLFRRVGIPSGVMLTQLGTAASLGLLAITHTAAQAACVYWAYMATQYMNEPGIYSLLMDRIPSSEHNGASASTFFVSSSAQVVASAATGAALAKFGYSPVLVCIAALAVIAAVLFRRLPATGMTGAARETSAPESEGVLTTPLKP